MGQAKHGLAAIAFLLAGVGRADTLYTFGMNLTPLVSQGVFTLDLQFVDGSGRPTDLNNNAVKLTDFAFGTGGGALGGGTATGGVSGSLASGVTLKDIAFFNEYMEGFTAGGVLTFQIDTTNVADPGGTPDLFTVAILDSSGNELPTTGAASEFLDVSLAGGTGPQVSTFGSAAGSRYELSAPVVAAGGVGAAPEPATVWEMLSGFGLVGWWRVRRGRRVRGAGARL
jgi:hypothetical protein